MASSNKSGFRHIQPFLSVGPVLDVGAAVGNELDQMPPGSQGLEGSPEFVAICRGKGLDVQQADFNEPLPVPDDAFDAVLCSHVLEHVLAPILLLRELRRVCKPHGCVVLGLPLESEWLDWRRKYFAGHPYHIYAFTERNARHMLGMVGLEPVTLVYDFPRGLAIAERLLNLTGRLFRQLAPSYWLVGRKVAPPASDLTKYSNEQLVSNWLRTERQDP